MMDPFNFLGFVFSAYSAYKASKEKTDRDIQEFIQSWSPLFELLRFFKSTHSICQTIHDHTSADIFQTDDGSEPVSSVLVKRWKRYYVEGLKTDLDYLKNQIDGFIKTGDQKLHDETSYDNALTEAQTDLRIKNEIVKFQALFTNTIADIDKLILEFREIDKLYTNKTSPNPKNAKDIIDGAAGLAMQDTDIMMLNIIPILIYFYEALRRDEIKKL